MFPIEDVGGGLYRVNDVDALSLIYGRSGVKVIKTWVGGIPIYVSV